MNELSDDTPVFRIYNFFDLINTLNTNSIRLSQASRMEDANELFGVYFDLLRSVFGPQNLEQVDQTQAKFHASQAHHYMTCWTRVADNIALWSLYSPVKDAIQVQTTYGKLRDAISTHFQNNPYALAYKLPPNDPKDLFLPPNIGPVEYIDFKETYSTLKRQCEQYFDARDRFFDDQIASGTELARMGEGWPSRDDQIREQVFEEPRLGGPLLKDSRYQHEQEVRFVLSLKRRDARTEEEYKAHPMAGLDDPSRHPPSEECPPNIFVPFASSNLMNFQVDGRVEGYKFEAISNALAKFGIETTKSSAFRRIEI